jgi:P27 family predicted phage terminase small subunit
LLTKIDRAALAAFCQCWAFYMEAVKDIQENGYSFISDKGYEGVRPSVTVMVRMLDKMAVYGAKFGFSPADRTRLTVPEKKEDELDALLG